MRIPLIIDLITIIVMLLIVIEEEIILLDIEIQEIEITLIYKIVK